MRDEIVAKIVSALYENGGTSETWRATAAQHGATPEEVKESLRRYEAIMDGAAPEPKRGKVSRGLEGSGLKLADAFLWIGAAAILIAILALAILDWDSLNLFSRITTVLVPNALLIAAALRTRNGEEKYRYLSPVLGVLAQLMLPLTFGVILSNAFPNTDTEVIFGAALLIPVPLYAYCITAFRPASASLLFAAVCLGMGASTLAGYFIEANYWGSDFNSLLITLSAIWIAVGILTRLAGYLKTASGELAVKAESIALSATILAGAIPFAIFSAFEPADLSARIAAALATTVVCGGLAAFGYRRTDDATVAAKGIAQRALILGAISSAVFSAFASSFTDNASASSFIFLALGAAYIAFGASYGVRVALGGGIVLALSGIFPYLAELLIGLGVPLLFFLAGAIAFGVSAYVRNRHGDKEILPADDAPNALFISDSALTRFEKNGGSLNLPRLTPGHIVLAIIAFWIIAATIGSAIDSRQNAIDQRKRDGIEKELLAFRWSQRGSASYANGQLSINTTVTAPKEGIYYFYCGDAYPSQVNGLGASSSYFQAKFRNSTNNAESNSGEELRLTKGENLVTISGNPQFTPSNSGYVACRASSYQPEGDERLSYDGSVNVRTDDSASRRMEYDQSSLGYVAKPVPADDYYGTGPSKEASYVFEVNL